MTSVKCLSLALVLLASCQRAREYKCLYIKVSGYGTVEVELFADDAPRNVANVASLANDSFYNGLTFHRLIPGFMIQGGDPNGDGTGGPGYTVPAEIKRKHERGSMAMVRKGDAENPEKCSNGSQFYICFESTPQLDGQYTVIGRLVDGWQILDSLEKAATDSLDRPLVPIVMEQVFATTQ